MRRRLAVELSRRCGPQNCEQGDRPGTVRHDCRWRAARCIRIARLALASPGVMAYSVSLRRREMGVRLALGAEPKAVLTLVWRDGLKLVLTDHHHGCIVGLEVVRAHCQK